MNGFGDPTEEDFWLGLEYMHLLTSSANYLLRIEVQAAANGKYDTNFLLCNVTITVCSKVAFMTQ